MKDKVVFAVFAIAYLVILFGYAAVFLVTDDADAIAMAGVAVSGALMAVTMIAAVILMSGGSSERYKELYIDGKDEDSDGSEK